MPILNMTYTGKKCPNEIKNLKKRIETRDGTSMMQYIEVHCFELAIVLDRLEYLENQEKKIKEFFKTLSLD